MGTLSRRCFSLLVASFGLLRPCLLLSLPSGGGLNRIPAVVKPAEGHNIHLWLFEGDMEAQDMAVEKALSPSVSFNEPAADPYGIVLWPAALPVAALTATMIRKGKVKRVTELGAGTGLVSIAAVSAGAESVLSTDYNEEALALLSLAADLNLPRGGPRERLRSALYDVLSSEDDNADNDSDATCSRTALGRATFWSAPTCCTRRRPLGRWHGAARRRCCEVPPPSSATRDGPALRLFWRSCVQLSLRRAPRPRRRRRGAVRRGATLSNELLPRLPLHFPRRRPMAVQSWSFALWTQRQSPLRVIRSLQRSTML